jgi:probable rRNA maturation factor
VSIEIANESGVDVDLVTLEKLARFVLDQNGVHPLIELYLRLVDVDSMTTLHEQFMDEPGPTDVLAFPMDDLHDHRVDEDEMDVPPTVLGDVVICPQVATAQAAAAGHSAEDEIHLLCTHGVLHLLGYDHGDDAEERAMFGLQRQLLELWGQVRR